MADLSDVTAYLAQRAAAAVYPNGTSYPSVANMDCRIFEGWPIPDQLDLDLAGNRIDTSKNPPAVVKRACGPCANVSIYPMLGQGAQVTQILDETYTISPAAIQMTMSLAGRTVTLTGTPADGEFLTIVVDDQHVYSRGGASVAAILAALLADIVAQYPASSISGNSLTVSGSFAMVVRQGGKAVLGKVTHRQRNSVMITVWAPNKTVRASLAGAIDNLIKQTNKVTMPDTSQALVIYNRTNTSDEEQSKGIYRRDLVFDVEYATVETFPGYTITSTQVSIAKPDNSAIAIATT